MNWHDWLNSNSISFVTNVLTLIFVFFIFTREKNYEATLKKNYLVYQNKFEAIKKTLNFLDIYFPYISKKSQNSQNIHLPIKDFNNRELSELARDCYSALAINCNNIALLNCYLSILFYQDFRSIKIKESYQPCFLTKFLLKKYFPELINGYCQEKENDKNCIEVFKNQFNARHGCVYKSLLKGFINNIDGKRIDIKEIAIVEELNNFRNHCRKELEISTEIKFSKELTFIAEINVVKKANKIELNHTK